MIRNAFGVQPAEDETVTDAMQILTYKEDQIQRIYTLQFDSQIDWDFDKHMPRNENCINLRNTYVDMQNEGLSMALAPKSDGACRAEAKRTA